VMRGGTAQRVAATRAKTTATLAIFFSIRRFHGPVVYINNDN
jgi:hypothetical protein